MEIQAGKNTYVQTCVFKIDLIVWKSGVEQKFYVGDE